MCSMRHKSIINIYVVTNFSDADGWDSRILHCLEVDSVKYLISARSSALALARRSKSSGLCKRPAKVECSKRYHSSPSLVFFASLTY